MSLTISQLVKRPGRTRGLQWQLNAIVPTLTHQRKSMSSAASTASSPTSLALAASAMKDRPPKSISDYLMPMPSHLLEITLTDLVGSSPPDPAQHPTHSSSTTASFDPSIVTSSSFSFSRSSISSPPITLPAGHHLVYFPIQAPPSLLAPDGADPTHSPGPPFTRRMWAGGQVNFHPGWERQLKLDGRPWTCREVIEDAQIKGVKGQEKIFVDVWRRYGLGHDEMDGKGSKREWQIEERRTLVFLKHQEEATKATASPPRILKNPQTPSARISLLPGPKHLFHYSALTYNAHAIHLDPLYTKLSDGHRGLLVHGPLSLTLMLRAVVSQIGPNFAVSQIDYRNYAPLYVGEEMSVCVREMGSEHSSSSKGIESDVGGTSTMQKWDAWVEGPDGTMCVRSTVVVKRNDR